MAKGGRTRGRGPKTPRRPSETDESTARVIQSNITNTQAVFLTESKVALSRLLYTYTTALSLWSLMCSDYIPETVEITFKNFA